MSDPNGVTLGPLAGAEVDSVVGIWNRAMRRDPMSANRFARLVLGDPNHRPGRDSGFLVATKAGQPIGFLRAVIRHWPNDRLGMEPDDGWIPYFAVDPPHQRAGVGITLLSAALAFFQRHRRRRVWVCGTPTSAPGSIVPGIDIDAYPEALSLLERECFVHDQEAFSMARPLLDVDEHVGPSRPDSTGPSVSIEALSAGSVHSLLAFVAEALPGAWCVAARAHVRAGRFDDVLLALRHGAIVGYCQWDGEHFGPFGVHPVVRNHGVGAMLFAEALRRMRQAGGRRVWFNWADENARRFYERFGLIVTRRFAVMRRDL